MVIRPECREPRARETQALNAASCSRFPTVSLNTAGSGSYPADASPATLVAQLDGPLDGRSVVTFDDQPVPEVDC